MADDLHTDAEAPEETPGAPPSDDDVVAMDGDAPVAEDHAPEAADGSAGDAADVAADESTPLPPRRLKIVAAVGAAVLIADQASKWWALNRLQNGEIFDLFWTLRFNLFYNTGVAFSLGTDSGLGPWISLLAIGVVVAVSFGTTSRYPLGAVASGLISGGALGNLMDRAFRGDDGFLHGAVIDFIDAQWWPVFNVADAAIVIGAILLVIASFRVPQ
ncbi:MAG: signal peptidase II [Aquihabitans sp.]